MVSLPQAAIVAVAARSSGDGLFHYAIPPALAGQLWRGHLVTVPFGRRQTNGIVADFGPPPAGISLRAIAGLVDPEPILTEQGVALLGWLASYYGEAMATVVTTIVPPGLSGAETFYIQLVRAPAEYTGLRLTGGQRAIIDALTSSAGESPDSLPVMSGDDLVLTTGLSPDELDRALRTLVQRKLVQRTTQIGGPDVRAKHERVIVLAPGAEGEIDKLSAGQVSVVRYLIAHDGRASGPQIGRAIRNSAGSIAALTRRGLVAVESKEVRRDPLAHRTVPQTFAPSLMPHQAAAAAALTRAIARREPATYLIHGITGSGKTEVYLHAAAQALAQRRRVMILVPEISLTPQTVARVAGRFPGRVALLHSMLGAGERFDEWRRVRSGEAEIVVGARSAIFAPTPDLGLIVLDEEHDSSYKQDTGLRYHTREVALELGRLYGATVVLGSATPDVTTYFRAQQGEFTLLELPTRARFAGVPREAVALSSGPRGQSDVTSCRSDVTITQGSTALASLHGADRLTASVNAENDGLPPVQVVDLRQELRAGNRNVFSRALIAAIESSLARGEQAIVFLNRRGNATFINCRDCGFVVRCHACDLPFTYHSATEDLICHSCDARAAVPVLCARCGSWRIRYFGLGTQRLEEATTTTFPGARVMRWDRDVSTGKHGHERILDRFVAHDADILIGTQLVAKGLDIPLVTTVGVISADVALNLPDYRAAERAFQVLTQVAGRAGRADRPGRVVIQTYTPEHFAVQAASRHDYATFYRDELIFRQQGLYPPFARLMRLIATHRDEATLSEQAHALANLLREVIERQGLHQTTQIIGPAPCFMSKARNLYRWQIVCRGDIVALFPYIPASWARDVDPLSLL